MAGKEGMCMKEWLEEYKGFWKNKFYCMMLGLTGLLSYGYLVTHQTVGIRRYALCVLF